MEACCYSLLWTLLLLGLTTHVCAKDLRSTKDPFSGTFNQRIFSSSLDSFVQDFISCREVPGLSIAIVRDNQTFLSKGYGFADVENHIAVSNDTLFGVCSLSKAFTALLLGILLEEKGYTFDTPLIEILPEELVFPDDYVTKHVTVRDLLSHRTGLPRYDFLWLAGAVNASQLLGRLRCMESGGFREEVVYNNIIYSVAGHVAEVLGRASWEDLVKKYILHPLGMKDTTFWSQRRHATNLATQYVNYPGRGWIPVGDKFQGVTAVSAACGILSSARDMTKWLMFLLNTSHQHAGIVSQLLAPSVVLRDKPTMFINEMRDLSVPHIYDTYGMAWFLGSYRSFPTAMHYGSFIGYYSFITLMPSQGIAIFSTINGGLQMSPYNINFILQTHVLDLLLGHVPQMTSQDGCHFLFSHDAYSIPDDTIKSMIPPLPLQKYTGNYYHPVFGNVTIKEKKGNLYMTYGQIEYNVYYNEQTFSIRPVDDDWAMWYKSITFIIVNNTIESVAIPFEYLTTSIFVKVPKDATKQWFEKKDSMCRESIRTAESTNGASMPTFAVIVFVGMFIFLF